jgi:hypothetical protein
MTMGQLLLMMLGLIAIFLLLIRFMGSFFFKRIERALPGGRPETEFIAATGLAPDSWTKRYYRVLNRMERRGAGEESRARFEESAKRRVIRRLRRVRREYQRKTVFGDQESRDAFLARLREVDDQWKQSRWTEFAPPGVKPGP